MNQRAWSFNLITLLGIKMQNSYNCVDIEQRSILQYKWEEDFKSVSADFLIKNIKSVRKLALNKH